jgi:Protein of unknown function (DUF2971)
MQKTSEVYERLYHYTTWDGLVGILQTKALWATHYKFLNDYSEIVLFRDKLISLILPHVREAYEELIKESPHIKREINQVGGLGQVVQHDTEVFVDAHYGATGDEIYILSFCGQHKNPQINSNGLLSQWRGYGAGGGFALVFNTQKLEEMMEIEAKKYEYSAMHLCDLVYSDDENKLKEELSEDLSIIAGEVKQLFNRAKLSEKEKADTLKGYIPFVHCISRYKHYGFSEENEVRMVVLPLNQEILKLASTDGVTLKPEKERKFRKKNGQLIPYIELFNSIDIGLPIERIIVGPHKEKEARAAALRVMLRNTKIEITCSAIPFVG